MKWFWLFLVLSNSSSGFSKTPVSYSQQFSNSLINEVNKRFDSNIRIQYEKRNCDLISSELEVIWICIPELESLNLNESEDFQSAWAFILLHEASQSLLGLGNNPFTQSVLAWSPRLLKKSSDKTKENLEFKVQINVDSFSAKLLREFGYSKMGIDIAFDWLCSEKVQCREGRNRAKLSQLSNISLKKNYNFNRSNIRETFSKRAYDEYWDDWKEYFKIVPLCDSGKVIGRTPWSEKLKIRSRIGEPCQAYNRKASYLALKRAPHIK